MEARAILRNTPMSAQKARLVANLIRKLPVSKAVEILRYTPKKGARVILKLLESAIANAENNYAADIDSMIVGKVYVDEAMTLKRMHARAKGRGNRISKRTCHISITVAEEEL